MQPRTIAEQSVALDNNRSSLNTYIIRNTSADSTLWRIYTPILLCIYICERMNVYPWHNGITKAAGCFANILRISKAPISASMCVLEGCEIKKRCLWCWWILIYEFLNFICDFGYHFLVFFLIWQIVLIFKTNI